MSKKKYSLSDLNRLYDQAETVDRAHFAEARSSLRLVSGDYFKKFGSAIEGRFKDTPNKEKRLRLVKNHVQKITKNHTNAILAMAPGVHPVAYNEQEMSDQKVAELSKAVWQDAIEQQALEAKIDEWADNFVVVGEVAHKIFWEPNKGKILGYNQRTDENGMPVFDEMGQPVADEDSPMREGQLCIETIHAHNLLRDPNAESIAESEYLIIRKMIPVEKAKAMAADEDTARRISAEAEEGFKIFDTNSSEYTDSGEGRVLVKEYYFRDGRFAIATQSAVLAKGKIPFHDELGDLAFPITYEGYDQFPTMARSKSIVRQLRPYAMEICRAASTIAETQLSLGTKVFINNGSKMQSKYAGNGLTIHKYSGAPPIIHDGKSGEQYLSYLNSQIDEMYKISPYSLDFADFENTTDPYAMLFKRMSQKNKNVRYVKKFERFLITTCKKYLALARRYYSDDRTVQAISKREAINIAEWKSFDNEGFEIKLMPVSQDLESMFGKQLQINQILQYVGQQLPDDVKGKIFKEMPFMNSDKMFNEFTIEDENIDNDILALDRGEYVPADKDDNHEKYIKRLKHRTKMSDFKFLDPQIQQMYMQRVQEHQQIAAQQAQELQAAQAGFIPSNGAQVKVDFYVDKPNGNGVERATLPMEAVQWLIDKLKQQGSSQENMSQLDQQAQLEILQQLQPQQPEGAMMPPQPMAPAY